MEETCQTDSQSVRATATIDGVVVVSGSTPRRVASGALGRGGSEVLVLPAPAAAARGETLLVSRANGPAGAGGDSDSYSPSISADGRFVAFSSGLR